MNKLAVFLLFAIVPITAHAQSADEIQRCVWSCLSNFGPASSPRYERCVRQNCSGFDEPRRAKPSAGNARGGWRLSRLSRADPPYIDGRAAVATASDGAAKLSYICGRSGDSYLFLDGSAVARMRLRPEQQIVVMLQIDNSRPQRLRFGEYEGALTASIPVRSRLLRSLGSGRTLSVTLPRYRGRISLRGSSRALSSASRYCDG